MKAFTKAIGQRIKIDAADLELTEKLVGVDRVTKVVKGGRQIHFRALVVVGDGNGCVGIGLAKARGVPDAIRKAGAVARKSMIKVPITDTTIPHEVLAKFGAAKVLLKPAPLGRGVIAAGGVRAVLEAAGVEDILTKSLGSSSSINVAKATMIALASLRKPEEAIAKRKTELVTEVTG